MYLKKYNLKNKYALVTGAGKGLGKACSIALAEAGANVIIISRTSKDLTLVSKIIKKLKILYGNKLYNVAQLFSISGQNIKHIIVKASNHKIDNKDTSRRTRP